MRYSRFGIKDAQLNGREWESANWQQTDLICRYRASGGDQLAIAARELPT